MTNPRPLRVGVDIGGSKIAVLVVDSAGRVIGRELAPSVAADPDLAIEQIAAVIRSAVASAGATMDAVEAIGVGVPGRVDRATGTVTFAVNLGWHHLPLGERLAATLGVPVHVENDVRTAAAGLHRRGPFGQIDDLAYLSIGTGISAGIVLGGRVHRGVRGVAGEIGHIVLEPGGPRCACGLDGCFEALAAGSAIARAARDAIATGQTTSLATIADPTAEDVFAAAAAGDAIASGIVERATTWIARMVHALVLAYDVRLVAIEAERTLASDVLWREGLIDLDQIHVVQRKSSALQRHRYGLRGPDPHDLRIHTDRRPGEDTSQRLSVPQIAFRGENDRCGAIDDTAGVPGRDHPVVSERRWQRAQDFWRCLWPGMLVSIDLNVTLSGHHLYRHDLSREVTLFLSGLRGPLAPQSILVRFPPANVKLLREILCRVRHVAAGVAVG